MSESWTSQFAQATVSRVDGTPILIYIFNQFKLNFINFYL